jgi:hypothetical protein
MPALELPPLLLPPALPPLLDGGLAIRPRVMVGRLLVDADVDGGCGEARTSPLPPARIR